MDLRHELGIRLGPGIYHTGSITLPLFLTLDLWLRHGYTVENVETTLDQFPAQYVWMCAVVLGVIIPTSAVKISFSSLTSMVFQCKKIAIRKIMGVVRSSLATGSGILNLQRFDHIPFLPLHSCGVEFRSELMDQIPRSVPLMIRPIHYTRRIRFRDIYVVPLWLDGDDILCIRVISVAEFEASGRPNHSLSTRPYTIVIAGETFAGLEEAMFFRTVIKKKKK